MVMLETAKTSLEGEDKIRNKIFDAGVKEVSTLLYQNIWDKFTELETELRMGDDEVKYFRSEKVAVDA
jgi:hypothetical protein